MNEAIGNIENHIKRYEKDLNEYPNHKLLVNINKVRIDVLQKLKLDIMMENHNDK